MAYLRTRHPPSQRAGDIHAAFAEANDARQAGSAERFRGRQEVDRFEEVRLALAVAPNDEVGLGVKGDRIRLEVAKVIRGDAGENQELTRAASA